MSERYLPGSTLGAAQRRPQQPPAAQRGGGENGAGGVRTCRKCLPSVLSHKLNFELSFVCEALELSRFSTS